MKYEYFDHYRAHCTKVSVIKRAVVSDENLGEILRVTAFELHPQINLGDVVSVLFFHNRSLRISGTVTIWHNNNHAAIKTYSASMAGEWIESLRLVVSEAIDDGWTLKGELVTGRLAMDINGVQGIYSCGEFYRQCHTTLPVAI
jgi:hypothetical protein